MPSLQLEFSTTLGKSSHAGEMHHTTECTIVFGLELNFDSVCLQWPPSPGCLLGTWSMGMRGFGSISVPLTGLWLFGTVFKGVNLTGMISSFIWRADPSSIITQETCRGLSISDNPAGFGWGVGYTLLLLRDNCCRFSSQWLGTNHCTQKSYGNVDGLLSRSFCIRDLMGSSLFHPPTHCPVGFINLIYGWGRNR